MTELVTSFQEGLNAVDGDVERHLDISRIDLNENLNKTSDMQNTSDLQSETGQEGDAAEFRLNLDTVPIEVFLHICSFLDSGFLLQNVSLVCKHLYAILSNEKTWKIRQEKRWGHNGKYPPVQVDEDEYSWSKACWKREEQIKLWESNGANLRNVELRRHIGCVDAVYLFEGGKYLASGSRDRNIAVWNVEEALSSYIEPEEATDDKAVSKTPAVASNSSIVHVNPAAHQGWIWAFASNHQYIVSASWDHTVKIWDKRDSFKLTGELKIKESCLCVAMTENVMAVGTWGKKVLMYDTRAGYSQIGSHKLHRRSVLALGMDDTRIISCSEDGSTILYDIRAQNRVKSIKLPGDAYPSCLSFRRDDPAPLFYLGDRTGKVHLVNSSTFELVESYDLGHKQIVQGVFHGLGSVFSCSKDGNFKVSEPSLGLKQLASLEVKAELPGVHSYNNTVALAGGDFVVRLWAPKENF